MNLNSRRPSSINSEGRDEVPQIRSIRFATGQRGNESGRNDNASSGISGILRSLGTMSFGRSVVNTTDNDLETTSHSVGEEGGVGLDDGFSQDKMSSHGKVNVLN